MLTFFVIFVFSLLTYSLLTLGSGDIFLLSKEEIILGLLFSALTALALKPLFNLLDINSVRDYQDKEKMQSTQISNGVKLNSKFLNPKRGFLFFIYAIGPFLLSLTKANFDVVGRIVTGKIKPGIVKISPQINSSFGITLLANSITLTPGTLTVDIDKQNNLYVHWLWVENKEPRIEQVAKNFAKWIKKITE